MNGANHAEADLQLAAASSKAPRACHTPVPRSASLGLKRQRFRQSSLSLGILALVLWAISWSWLIGVGVTVVRFGEVGALLAGLTAVALGVTAPKRPQNIGLWIGVVALTLVIGLNLLGLLLR